MRARIVVGLLVLALAAAPRAWAVSESASGPGSNLGDAGAAVGGIALSGEAQLGTGAASATIPVQVPQGRNGMQPNLALRYSSQAGVVSPYGLGWTLPIGTLERSRRFGVPSYNGNDRFAVNLPDGVVDLVQVSGSTYAGRIDESHFAVTANTSANYWTLHDTSGRTYTFGCDSGTGCAAVVGKGAGFTNTAAWHLTKVTDANGNAVTYTYVQIEGTAYPLVVAYGGNGALAAMFAVEFEWTYYTPTQIALQRPIFGAGFRQRLAAELKSVSVKYRGGVVRKLELFYHASTATGALLLDRVRQSGVGGQPFYLDGTTTPADVTFTYYERPSAYFESTPTPMGSALFTDSSFGSFQSLRQQGVQQSIGLIDVNADGRPDYVQSSSTNWNGTDHWKVWLNGGRQNGIFQGQIPASCWSDIIQCLNDLAGCTGGYGCTVWPSPAAAKYVNKGLVPYCTEGSPPQCGNWVYPNNTTAYTMDVNGDGFPDVADSGQATWRMFLSNGAGFSGTPAAGPWTPDGPARELRGGPWQDSDDLPEDPTDYHPGPGTWTDLADMNGDGRPDVVSTKEWASNDRRWKVWINTGSGFAPGQLVPGPTKWLRNGGSAGTTDDGKGPSIQDMDTDLFDLNGDGLVDKVKSMGNRNRAGRPDCVGWHWEIWFGTGTDRGWVGINGDQWQPYCWASPPRAKLRKWNDDRRASWDLVDVTGDGLPDFVDAQAWNDSSEDTKRWHLWRNTGAGFVDEGFVYAPNHLRWHDTDHSGDTPPRYTDITIDSIDMDGDGAVDVVRKGVGVWFGNPDRTRADTLKEILQPTGHRQTFTYAPSASFNDTLVDPALRDGKLHLPFPVWVVTRIDETDGARYAHTSSFSYGGGYYDTLERDFRGFHTTTKRDWKGVMEVTRIHQTDVLRGKPMEAITYAPDGVNAVKWTTSIWQCDAGGGACPTAQVAFGPRYFPALRSVTHYDYSNQASNPYAWTANLGAYKARTTAYLYDACGNVTKDVTEPGLGANAQSPSASAVVNIAAYAPTDGAGTTVNVCDTTNRICPAGGYCNRPTTIEQVGGVKKTLIYHTNGNLKTTTFEGGDAAHSGTTTLEYGTYGQVTKTTGPLGTVSEIVKQDGTQGFDADFLYPITSKRHATDGSTSTVLWTSGSVDARFSQPTLSVDENDVTVRRVYDAFGRLCKVYLPGDPYAPGGAPCGAGSMASDAPTERYAYAVYVGGSRIEKYLKVTASKYLAQVKFHDALGRHIQTQVIEPVAGLDKLVVTHADVYDNSGLVTVSYVAKQIDGTLAVTVLQNPVGVFSARFYDPLGRLVDAYQTDGRSYVRTTYPAAWVVRTCDPNASVDATSGKCAEQERDFADRVIEERVYVGGATSWYSKETRTYNRDARSRVVTQNGIGTTTVTTLYDLLGRTKEILDPDAGVGGTAGRRRFDYDRGGNLVYEDDPKSNQHVEYRYDGLGRMVQRWQYAGDDRGQGTPTLLAQLTYDCSTTTNGKGRLCGIVERSGTTGETTIQGYEPRGPINKQTKTIRFQKPGASQPIEVFFTSESVYEPSTGKLLRTTFPKGNGASEWFHDVYGPHGELQRIQSDGGEFLSGTKHDYLGRLTEIAYRNGVRDMHAYKAAGDNFRLDRIWTHRDGDPLNQNLRDVGYFDFDRNGNLLGVRDLRFGPRAGPSATATAGYDAASRLVSARQCGGAAGSSWLSSTFVHDALGNLTFKNGNDQTPSSSKRHQYASVETGGGAVSVPLTYDADGNLTALPGNRSLIFDVDNHLTEVRQGPTGPSTMIYAYDYAGARVVAYDVAANETTFFFGGFDYRLEDQEIVRHVVAGRRLVASSVVSGRLTALADARPTGDILGGRRFAATAAGTLAVLVFGVALAVPGRVRRRGLPRVRRAAVTALAAVVWIVQLPVPDASAQCPGKDGPAPAGTIFYHLDHLGSPRVLTDHTGAVVEYLGYEPYGSTTNTIWGVDEAGDLFAKTRSDSSYQFTGHRGADAAGLIYMGARFYEPELGVFLSHDPARQFFSPYNYGGGNPLNGTDPSGAFFGIDDLIYILLIVAIVTAVAQAVYTGVTAGLAASQNGASIGEAIGTGIGQAVLSLVVSAVGFVVGAGVGAIAGNYVALAAQLASAGYGIYSGVTAIQAGDYGAGAFALAGAAQALVGAGLTINRISNPQFAAAAQGADSQNAVAQNGGREKAPFWTVVKNRVGNFFGYSAQDSAAVAALEEANPQSIADNLEYGGLIYEEGGDYHFTEPQRGTPTGYNTSSARPLVPKTGTIVGDYHTHGDYSHQVGGNVVRTTAAMDAFNSNNFSAADIRGITADAVGIPSYRGYLGTPSGVFRAYDPHAGHQYVIP
jgi:RHS repeat-associated protein